MNKRLFIYLVFMLVIGQVYAVSSYYVKLNAKVASHSVGMGKVYASITNDDKNAEYNAESYLSDEQGGSDKGVPVSFYAFAKMENEVDCHFLGWSMEDNGDIVSKDNPYEVKLKTPSEQGTEIVDVFANFFKKVECKHLINKSEGVVTATDGTKTVTAPGYITTKEELSLSAGNVEGKDFLGWYYIDNGKKVFFSFEQKAQKIFDVKRIIGAEYVNKSVAAYYVKETGEMYTSFNTAVSAAKKCNGTVVVVHDGVLEAGEYTIPENVTLLIPFDSKLTCYRDKTEAFLVEEEEYSQPTSFKTLTLKEGAVLNVKGQLSVSAKMIAARGDTYMNHGGVNGKYGLIDMESGSMINLGEGARLYVWGYITGEGMITANKGSLIFENFQMTDFRGGTASSKVTQGDNAVYKIFPLNQYYVQNIEAPLNMYYGSELDVTTCVFSSTTSVTEDATPTASSPMVFIGKGGMFELKEGSMLVKRYDGKRDRQVYEINGDAILGSISLSMLGYSTTSNSFVLPLTNNLSISVGKGTLSYTNPNGIALLPGAEVTIKEGATLDARKGSIYLYDADDWGNYSCYDSFRPLRYAPSRSYERTELEDAKLDIQGTLLSEEAYIYTTLNGAEMLCSDGSGKIVLGGGAGGETETYQARQIAGQENNTKIEIDAISITPAKLHNTDGSYTETASATAGTTYYYVHGKWQTEEMSGLLGDVNRDGKVDVEDVKALSDILAGKDASEYDMDAADVDNNGRVTVRDMVKLIIMIGK